MWKAGRQEHAAGLRAAHACRRWATELRAIVALPEVNARLLDFGFEPMADVTDFPAYIGSEVKRWADVIREFNISI